MESDRSQNSTGAVRGDRDFSPILTILDYHRVWGQKARMTEVVRLLKQFDRGALVQMLCFINCLLDADEDISPKVQGALLASMFEGEELQRVRRAAERARSNVVFWQEPVLKLINLAAVHCDCRLKGFEWTSERRESLGRVLLMMGELCSRFASRRRHKGEGDLERFCRLAITQRSFRLIERPQYAMARYPRLFEMAPAEAERGSSLADLFAQATEITLRDYICLGCALLSRWVRLDIDSLETGAWQKEFGLRLDNYFARTDLKPRVLRYTHQFFVQSLDEFAGRLSQAKFAAGVPDPFCTILRHKPLLEVEPGVVIPCGTRFLIDKAGGNLYWLLLDGLPQSQKGVFLTDLGYRFGEYVVEVLRAVFGGLAEVIHYGKDRREATDCVVQLADEVLFFEAKSGRLRLDVETQGDIPGYLTDMREKLVLKGFQQIADRVTDFEEGHFDIEGRGAKSFESYRAVVVTLVPLPHDPILWKLLEKQPEVKALRTHTKVKGLHVISAEELEIMEALCCSSGESFVGMVKEKEQWEKQKDRWSFKHFLFDRYGNRYRNERLTKLYDELWDDTVKRLGIAPRGGN